MIAAIANELKKKPSKREAAAAPSGGWRARCRKLGGVYNTLCANIAFTVNGITFWIIFVDSCPVEPTVNLISTYTIDL